MRNTNRRIVKYYCDDIDGSGYSADGLPSFQRRFMRSRINTRYDTGHNRNRRMIQRMYRVIKGPRPFYITKDF